MGAKQEKIEEIQRMVEKDFPVTLLYSKCMWQVRN
jgi:hypothetical protein